MHHCEVCSISFDSEGVFQQHITGKKHRRRQRAVEENAERLRSVNVYPVRTAADKDSVCVYANAFGAVSKSTQITDSSLRVTFALEDSARRISAKKHHYINGCRHAIYAVQPSEQPVANQNAGGSDLQPVETVAADDDLARMMNAVSSVGAALRTFREQSVGERTHECLCPHWQLSQIAHSLDSVTMSICAQLSSHVAMDAFHSQLRPQNEL